MTGRIGVCSWSLRAGSPAELARLTKACGVSWVQVALDPLRSGEWSLRETQEELAAAGVGLLSGMMGFLGEDYSTLETIRRTGGVRLDEHWSENAEAALENARIARELGLRLVTLHAGFLPHQGEALLRQLMIQRVRTLVDSFAEYEVDVALETGQEDAETLLGVLQDIDRPQLGVNFDPANMILYGMGDPVAAMRVLRPHVRQLHVKDALPSPTPGAWGEEVTVGTGDVAWASLFEAIGLEVAGGLPFDASIEREAGGQRVPDIQRARQVVEELLRAREEA